MQQSFLTDKQDNIFISHIADIFSHVQTANSARYSAFLEIHQQTLIKQYVATIGKNAKFLLWGGYEKAERSMLGVFASWEEPDTESFPIFPITLRYREKDAVGHRDVLGSLMGLSIKRETIGDILIDSTIAVCFLTEPAADTAERELTKIGKFGITLARGLPDDLPDARRYEDIAVVVASLRLDCIVSALSGLSREKSTQLLRGGLVQLNGAVQENTSKQLAPGDILSIRGFGKFLYEYTERQTQKGRLRILCKKYI